MTAFEIFLHPSDKTEGPKAFALAVERTFGALGGRHSAAAETVRLADRTQIHLFLDAADGVVRITAQSVTPEVGRAVYRLAEESGALIQAGGETARTPSGGAPLPALGVARSDIEDMDNEAELADFLRFHFDAWRVGQATAVDRQEAASRAAIAGRSAAKPPPYRPLPDLVSTPQHSLLRRLSDALFGKAL